MTSEEESKRKEEIKQKGQQLGLDLPLWNDLFDTLSLCRKAELSELETWCVLSNTYRLQFKESDPRDNPLIGEDDSWIHDVDMGAK